MLTKYEKENKMRHFLIEKMRNVDWVKTVATLSVVTLDEHEEPVTTIHDCKLVDGANGFFISVPSKKVAPYQGKDGKTKEYMDLAYIHPAHREELNKLASEMYDPNATNKTEEKKTLETADTDIPF